MYRLVLIAFSLLTVIGPLLADESTWTVDRIPLRIDTSEVNRMYGAPKYFEIEGFASNQRPVRSYYGDRKSLPAIEWNDAFKVTRIAGRSLQSDSASIKIGATPEEVERVLGPSSKIQDNLYIYRRSGSELQVFFDAEKKVKMFNLLAL